MSVAAVDWVDRSLYPFEDRWLDLGHGGRLHYVDEGPSEGPVVLLLHGNPTWSFLWRDVIAELRDSHRCIAPDYPGFGLSTAAGGYRFTPVEHAAVIERLVVELDLRGVTLVVQDWGGPIGFAVAGRHPDRFDAFVIGNTWAWPMTRRSAWVFSRALGGPVGRQLIRHRNVFVEQIIPGGTSRELAPAVMEHYRRPFPTAESREPTAVFPKQIIDSAAFLRSVEHDLPRLRDKRAALVWPDSDPAFGAAELARWRSLFPAAEVVELPGAKHYIPEEAPTQLAAAVRSLS